MAGLGILLLLPTLGGQNRQLVLQGLNCRSAASRRSCSACSDPTSPPCRPLYGLLRPCGSSGQGMGVGVGLPPGGLQQPVRAWGRR